LIAQNWIAVSVSCAIPPDDKMPDKADCMDQSVSRLAFAVDAKDEGEGRTYTVPEPDNADSALHPVVEKIKNGAKPSPIFGRTSRSVNIIISLFVIFQVLFYST
jgi:hypothetical protein